MPPILKANFSLDWGPSHTEDGGDALLFVAKRVYAIDATRGCCTLEGVDEQPPIHPEDVYEEGADATTGPVVEDGEMAPFKRKVDVVVKGTAFAPGGAPAPAFDVTVEIGGWRKVLRVYGSRHALWQPPRRRGRGLSQQPPVFSAPAPIATLPLTWQNAWGGRSLLVPADPEAYAAARRAARESCGLPPETESERPAPEDAAAAAPSLAPGDLATFFSPRGGRVSRDAPTVELTPDVLAAAADAERDLAPPPSLPAALRPGDARILLADGTPEGDDAWIAAERARAEDGRRTAPDEPPPEEPSPYDRIACPHNPVGKGFALGNTPETIAALELPNVEDPARPLRPEDLPRDPTRLLEDTVVPAGFGWVARSWCPRARWGGVPPEQVERVREALHDQALAMDPEDPAQRPVIRSLLDDAPPVLRPEFYNGAPVDQQLDTLEGDEEVALTNLDPSGLLWFRLPGLHPVVTLDRGQGAEPVPIRLDTLVLDVDALRVTMIWRGQRPIASLDEIAGWPRLDVDARETTRAERHDERWQQAKDRALHERQTLEIPAVEVAAAERRGSSKAAEYVPRGAGRKAAARDGAKRIDSADRGLERLHDDGWARAIRTQKRSEGQAAAALAAEKDGREARTAALRERLAELAAAPTDGKKKRGRK